MKIFIFEFMNTIDFYYIRVEVLANSEEEAYNLIKKDKRIKKYFNRKDTKFEGCIDIIELDKPKIIY